MESFFTFHHFSSPQLFEFLSEGLLLLFLTQLLPLILPPSATSSMPSRKGNSNDTKGGVLCVPYFLTLIFFFFFLPFIFYLFYLLPLCSFNFLKKTLTLLTLLLLLSIVSVILLSHVIPKAKPLET